MSYLADGHIQSTLDWMFPTLSECMKDLCLDQPADPYLHLGAALMSRSQTSSTSPAIMRELQRLNKRSHLTQCLIRVSCRDLPRGDRKEQCDPMVVVYADDSDHTGKKFTFLAQTERLQNAHDPRFQRPLIIQFNPRSKLRFAVYDSESGMCSAEDLLGEAYIRAPSLVKMNTHALALKHKGMQAVHNKTGKTSYLCLALDIMTCVSMRLECSNLPSLDKLSYSDPMACIFVTNPLGGTNGDGNGDGDGGKGDDGGQVNGAGGGKSSGAAEETWMFVGQTERLQNNPHPEFKTIIDASLIPNFNAQVKVVVYDADEGAMVTDDDVLGECVMDLNEIRAGRLEGELLTKKGSVIMDNLGRKATLALVPI